MTLRLFSNRSRVDLQASFGHLEVRVLEVLWARERDTRVRDLQPDFPQLAYTTLMTTLDRLYRKGVLDRTKSGRAFLYRPRYSRDELRSGLAESALGSLLEGDPISARPMLSCFVDAVSRRDRALLDELERLVREKRQQQEKP